MRYLNADSVVFSWNSRVPGGRRQAAVGPKWKRHHVAMWTLITSCLLNSLACHSLNCPSLSIGKQSSCR